jgi:hypothetical protein
MRCGECERSVFVLARSPWPSLDQPATQATARSSLWRRPLLAAVFTLVIVAAALVVLLGVLIRRDQSPEHPSAHMEAGRQAWTEGKLRRAADEFDAARRLYLQNPSALSLSQARELEQCQRLAHLLADLLTESVGEILQRATRLQEDDWRAQFQQRYKGPGKANAVIFAMQVHRNGAGQYEHDWDLKLDNEKARMELGGLKVLHALPLEQPRQLLFGARLGSIAREQNGVWVVRFESDSGVLLTDLSAARARCPPDMAKELPALLEQQRAWLQGK